MTIATTTLNEICLPQSAQSFLILTKQVAVELVEAKAVCHSGPPMPSTSSGNGSLVNFETSNE